MISKLLVGFLYSLELPLGVVSGYRFALGDWLTGAILVGITMVIEIACASKWIGVQTHDITKALVNQA